MIDNPSFGKSIWLDSQHDTPYRSLSQRSCDVGSYGAGNLTVSQGISVDLRDPQRIPKNFTKSFTRLSEIVWDPLRLSVAPLRIAVRVAEIL